MATTESIKLNEYATERKRTTSSGTKSHFTVSVQSEPLQITTDELAVGAGLAVALKQVLASQIQNIGETASAGTLLARKYAESGFARGARWARKRYAGGRTGTTPPGQSDRLFNDSGRLANNLTLRANSKEAGLTVNVPVNRFDESTFSSRTAFLAMLERFRSLVPALRDPRSLLTDTTMVKAMRETLEKVLVSKADASAELRSRLFRSGVDFARTLVGTVDDIAGV